MLPHDDDAPRLAKNSLHFAEFFEHYEIPVPELDREAIVWGHCHHKATGGMEPGAQAAEMARPLPRLIRQHPALRAYFVANKGLRPVRSNPRGDGRPVGVWVRIPRPHLHHEPPYDLGGDPAHRARGRRRDDACLRDPHAPHPEHQHGVLTGFYSFSRGLGIIVDPILAGALISLIGTGPFQATNGFQAMWIVLRGGAVRKPAFRPPAPQRRCGPSRARAAIIRRG